MYTLRLKNVHRKIPNVYDVFHLGTFTFIVKDLNLCN